MDAKDKLDQLIKKSRVHLYKPIQIAEILNKSRNNAVDISDLNNYRTQSRKWRDNVSELLVGNISTSSARFQDNLFDDNAIPSNILKELDSINKEMNGLVEAYIYTQLYIRLSSVTGGISYCLNNTKETFDLDHFIKIFWQDKGLRKSVDKIFECVVYALFFTIIKSINTKITMTYDNSKSFIIEEFHDFTDSIMNLSFLKKKFETEGEIYRLGSANASDGGLDLLTNFGVVIQVKHLSLTEEIAEGICNYISSDRIVIVCKTAEKNIIQSLLTQIGWKSKIQSIVTEDNLISWYEKALRGNYANITGDLLISTLIEEIQNEFPATGNDCFENFYFQRSYNNIVPDGYWLKENIFAK